MTNQSTIVLTGGGTAGHVMPNINLEKQLKKYFSKIIYIGSHNGIEKKLINEKTSYVYKSISTVKLERKKILRNILIPFKLSKAIKEAKLILKETKPDVVFSKGGYVSLPVVIAAKKLNIPIICHESDISVGLANKISAKYTNVICTNFKVTAEQHKGKFIHTGMPLPLSTLTKQQAKQQLKINTTKPVLLITGGSLGSKALNQFVYENIKQLTQNYYVYHLVGKGNQNKKIKMINYQQLEFSNDMWTIFRATDYAISRAGANTIIELLSNNILSVFVPLPKSVSRGDQIDNALFLEKNNLSKTVFQEDLSIKKVQNALDFLKNNNDLIKNQIKKQKFTDGTQNIINEILQQKKHT